MNLSATATPATAAPVPNHGFVPVTDLAANPAKFDGGRVATSGTYINSMKTVYDESGIVSMGVPGPVKGAAGIKVDGLKPSFIDGMQRDQAYGTDERWDDVILGGIVSVKDGVGLLKVDDAEYAPDPAAADSFGTATGGFIN